MNDTVKCVYLTYAFLWQGFLVFVVPVPVAFAYGATGIATGLLTGAESVVWSVPLGTL